MSTSDKFKRLTCTAALRQDLKHRSLRAVTSTAGASGLDFIIRLGSTAVLARLILPEQFGLVMMVTAVISIADQFRELGLSAATIQQPSITHQQVSNLFWINVAAGSAIALIICALAPFLSAFYKEPRLTPITCALATTFLFGGLLVQHQALLTRQLRMSQTALVRVLSSLLSTLLAIGLAWADYGYWALIWREIAKAALLTLGVWICFPWVPGLPSKQTNVRSLLGFGTNLTGANILATISAGADRFFIGRLLGALPVAMYRQAYQLIVAPMDQLLSPIYQVTQPVLSLLQKEPTRYLRFYLKVLTAVSIWTIPTCLFAAVYYSEITQILLGSQWTDAAPIFCILCLGAAIKQPVGSVGFVLITTGRSQTYLRLTLLHNITLILLIATGVHWGTLGVAVADVSATYLLAGPRLYFSLKDSPVSVRSFFSVIARPIGAGLMMVGVLIFLNAFLRNLGALERLSLGALVAFLTFFGTWVLLPQGKADLQTLGFEVLSLFKRRMVPST